MKDILAGAFWGFVTGLGILFIIGIGFLMIVIKD